jgi:hypothetical protein
MATAKKTSAQEKKAGKGHDKPEKKAQKKGWPTWAWYAMGGAGALGILVLLWVRQSATTTASTTTTAASPVLVSGTTGASTGDAGTNSGNDTAALEQQNAILAQLLALGETESATPATSGTTSTTSTSSTPQSAGKVVSYKESVAKPGTIRVTATTATGTNRTYLQPAKTVFSLTHVKTGVESKAIGQSIKETQHLQELAKGAMQGNTRDANRLQSLGYKGAK